MKRQKSASERFLAGNSLTPIMDCLEPRVFLSAVPHWGLAAHATKVQPSGAVRDDYPNTAATAVVYNVNFSAPTTLAGKIEATGDLDFTGGLPLAGGTLKIDAIAVIPRRGTPVDPELRIYDALGNQVAYNNDKATGQKDASITLTVLPGVKYYACVSGYGGTVGDYTLKYTLQVAPAPATTPPSYLPDSSAYSAGAILATVMQNTSNGMCLVVVGTNAADTATISQDGQGIWVSTPVESLCYTGISAGVVIYGFDGADNIRVTNSVSLVSVTYAGTGNDGIRIAGTGNDYVYGQAGQDTIVTIGGGRDVIYAGADLDGIWMDSTDLLQDQTTDETAAKAAHTVNYFYQPSTSPSQYISLDVAGQNLADPDIGTTSTAVSYVNFASQPLWVDGAQYNDIRQGAAGDCAYLASMAAIADTDPVCLQQAVVSLGDGTYAVRLYNALGGTVQNEVYVRVDADLPYWSAYNTLYYAKPTLSGEYYVAIMEKALAQFRDGLNSYTALDRGNGDWGLATISGVTAYTNNFGGQTSSEVASFISSHLAAGNPLAAATNYSNTYPVIGNHEYTIKNLQVINGVTYVTVYNPWGYDGYPSQPWDDNYNDGLTRITIDEFMVRFYAIHWSNL